MAGAQVKKTNFTGRGDPSKGALARRALASIALLPVLFGCLAANALDSECPIIHPLESKHPSAVSARQEVNPQLVDLSIIRKIESSNNPRAYNKNSGARGLYQITPICLKDYKIFHPSCKWTLDDLYTASVSQAIAEWYIRIRIPWLLRHYHLPVTTQNILRAYNAGILSVIKGRLPKETADYISKHNRLTKPTGATHGA